MAYILKFERKHKKPLYFKRLQACGLPDDTLNRDKARKFKQLETAQIYAGRLNYYNSVSGVVGGYEIEIL